MQLKVKLVLKEWQFSDGSHSMNNFHLNSRASSLYGSSNLLTRTGRKIYVTVVEGKDLMVKDRFGKCDPYVKLQYGKVRFSCPLVLDFPFIIRILERQSMEH